MFRKFRGFNWFCSRFFFAKDTIYTFSSISKTVSLPWNMILKFKSLIQIVFSPLAACRGGLLVCSLSVRLSVSPSVCLSHFCFSDFSQLSFEIIDFKFSIWICHDIIQIKVELHHAWPTFIRVIALC